MLVLEIIKNVDNLELSPKYQKRHGLGPDIYYRLLELGPGIFNLVYGFGVDVFI